MDKNTFPKQSIENEIDLIEVIKILLGSWKLIVLITLAFASLTFMYDSLKEKKIQSEALIEIASINFLSQSSDFKTSASSLDSLIEPMSNLLRDLNIQKYKQFEGVRIDNIENKLLLIKYTSSSILSGEKKIKDLIEYIEKRHSGITTEIINSINNKIKEINLELIFHEGVQEKAHETYQALNFRMPNQYQDFLQIQKLLLEIQSSGEALFQLKKAKRFHEAELFNITNQNVKVKMFQKIRSSEVDSNLLLVLIAAFIGFILSFITVFIIKAFRSKIES